MPTSTRRKSSAATGFSRGLQNPDGISKSERQSFEATETENKGETSSIAANQVMSDSRSTSSKDPSSGRKTHRGLLQSPSLELDGSTKTSRSSSSKSLRLKQSAERGVASTGITEPFKASPRGAQAHLFSPSGSKSYPYFNSTRGNDKDYPMDQSILDQNGREYYDRLDLNDDSLMGEGIGEDLFAFDESESPARGYVGNMNEDVDAASFQGSSKKRQPSSARRFRKSDSRPGPFHGRHFTHHQHPPSQHQWGNSYLSSFGGDGVTSSLSNGNYPPQGAYFESHSPYHRFQGGRSVWKNHRQPYTPPSGATIGPPYESDDEEELIPAPPLSIKKRALSPAGRRGHSTPQKKGKSRSPFRSPAFESTKKRPPRASPFFQASPNVLGTYGSFDFETPNGVLARGDFSPLGPSFDAGEEVPFCSEPFSASRWNLSRSLSQESGTSPISTRRRRHLEPSPLSGYMGDMSPIQPPPMEALMRSPIPRPASDSMPFDTDLNALSASIGKPVAGAVTISGSRREPPSSRLDGAEPKQLWPPSESSSKVSPSTSGALRLEIGSSGSVSTRKKLEGINSMMHPRHEEIQRDPSVFRYGMTPSRRNPPPHPAPHLHQPIRHQYTRLDMGTPGNVHYQRPIPPMGGRHPPFAQHPSAQKHMYPPSAIKADYQAGPPHKALYIPRPPSNANSTARGSGSSPAEKENGKKISSKRSPCNCKKSKCLKLYCECFAAERFCQGCNCADCQNTVENRAVRDKAIKDTRAKNSKAFQSRFIVKDEQGSENTHKVHNMGCKCKKSECLKKYCECFQAGVICGSKCKCVDCANFAGSQALIDKRRKIKDPKGADFAMRVADEVWKGRPFGSARKPTQAGDIQRHQAPGHPSNHHGRHLPSPAGRMPHMMHPSPHGGPTGGRPFHHLPPHHPHFMGPPLMNRHPPPMGYSPMGVPLTPSGYRGPPLHRMPPHDVLPRGMYPPPANSRQSSERKAPPAALPTNKNSEMEMPTMVTPKTPAVRTRFDPSTSRKKRDVASGSEPIEAFFGTKVSKQPKTTALTIFSYLPNDDLFNAGLVCKTWSKLAVDSELWSFQTPEKT